MSLIFETPEILERIQNTPPSSDALILGETYAPLIRSGYIPKTSIRSFHPEVGKGLFAEEPLGIDAYIGEYTGVVRRNDMRRYLGETNDYCYAYPVHDQLGTPYVIDAREGNLTRFINHSNEPNLIPRYAYLDGVYHLIFLAVTTIEIGTQLTYNYGKHYWNLRSPPLQM